MAPVDDALDRLEHFLANGDPRANPMVDIATVRSALEQLREERDAFRIEGDHGHDDYEDAEDIIRQIAEKRPNQSFDPWASGLCQEFLDRPRRSKATIATIRDRAEAAEAELERLRRHPDAWSQEAFDQQKARAEAAEAEVQRLREGLRRQQRLTALYAHRLGEHDPGCEWCVMAAEQEAAEARALLADSPVGGEAK